MVWRSWGGGWLHLPLNPLRMQKLTENYVVCNGKIKRALGVERMPVGAREGVCGGVKSLFTVDYGPLKMGKT